MKFAYAAGVAMAICTGQAWAQSRADAAMLKDFKTAGNYIGTIIYQKGMTGAVDEIETCYASSKKNRQICFYIDAGAKEYDKGVAAQNNFSTHPFFRDDLYYRRVGKAVNADSRETNEVIEYVNSVEEVMANLTVRAVSKLIALSSPTH